MSFVFYDTETTGTETSFDQILQFAAIRTDHNLNELERFDIRCQLLPHIVPAPTAMWITGVTVKQLTDPALPTHYQMIRAIREKLQSWSPSLFIGYNSLMFDEHLLRQAFYQTLHPVYLTNTAGNSRADVLKIVQAASLFATDILTIPVGDKNRSVFKLDRVAPANGFDHENAHDALADVEATIHLCRIVKERAPAVWTSFMKFSYKSAVTDFVHTEPVFSLSEFYYNIPYSWLVTIIGVRPGRDTEILVLDLANDPDELAALSPEELTARLKKSPKPIRTIKANASPTLMPLDAAPMIAAALALGSDELNRRVQSLRDNSELRERLIATHCLIKEENEEAPSEHVEAQIYAGFSSAQDQRRLDAFHKAQWEERHTHIAELEDNRLKTLAKRLLYFERRDLLDAVARKEHDIAIARRLLTVGVDVPWLSLPKAIAEIETLLDKPDENDRALLVEHREYLVDRLEKAVELLKINS